MYLNLTGKTAIVTGSSRGVGRDIALTLAKEGANIVLHYNKSEEQAMEVAETINQRYSKCIAVRADLAKEEECRKLIKGGTEEFGDINILVNNAGVWPKNWVSDITIEEWESTFKVNLTSVFLTCQCFIKNLLKKGQQGTILNLTSQAAFHGSTTGHAHYAASKAGVVSFTVSLAREVAKNGINVNALALGIVETDMIGDALKKNRDYYVNRIPIGRVAQTEEIAQIAAFLVSEKAGYMTGATVDATGGMLMR